MIMILKRLCNIKNKSKIKSNKIKNYEKRIRDLSNSRNSWKEKANLYKQQAMELKKELKKNF